METQVKRSNFTGSIGFVLTAETEEEAGTLFLKLTTV